GQPYVSAKKRMRLNPRVNRANGLYDEDMRLPQRKSHKNHEVEILYKEYLGEPNGHLAHELLHTHYEPKDSYNTK
ncbi:MAG: iron hydrogenase small subunit, partial [Firmicutes bacterium]|nr:iron hydrogenase small subunit [Bacillota bacterium]